MVTDISLCANCQEPVQPNWKTCPICSRSLAADTSTAVIEPVGPTAVPPSPRSRRGAKAFVPLATPSIEKDTETDTTVIGVILLALGVLGVLGIFLHLLSTGFGANMTSSVRDIQVIGIAVIVVISVGASLMTRRSGTGVSIFAGIFSGLATAGLIAAVVMMVIIASILNFCLTCGGLMKN